ncbi:ISAs1 family transposase [Oxynema aestuarii]|jgi:predicted transposase YbfD/YdcC|uniref:ISAs1 family transposase n=1 Tax=Oxynema aestuarii AP17 TaxID=2064643 RepID=A0A6H1U015_9CYAN|nr:ISAs1 family transposase [Oxynema aestuarii]QIZ72208.1 ISAs1 family transposase [Oxynema aestuarii AP17]
MVEAKNKKTGSQFQSIPSISEVQDNLLSYVEEIKDPRSHQPQKHLLKNILAIGILAVIAGAEGWEDMENYGLSKYVWLKEFLALPNGIPSDDTFRRVFERINPLELERILARWLQSIMRSLVGEVVSIDGKCLRGSYDREKGIKALSLLTVWPGKQQLILGKVKVQDKSNEIPAIPTLLKLLDLQGAVVTIDALGTQVKIVQQIQAQKADYVLALKKNHSTLYTQIEEEFESLRKSPSNPSEVSYEQRLEKGHHRVEKRRVWAIPISQFTHLHHQEQWCGLQTIVVVERIRHFSNKTTREVQFYLSSPPANASLLGKIIRQNWGIENQVHWALDVTFNEDYCRIRSGHTPHNLSLLRRWTLNVLRQETTLRRSLRQKQKRAAMNNDYMTTVLKAFCQA